MVLYLSGGNDALSTVVPYTDPFYYTRRPTLAVPAGRVLQIGSDSNGNALGLHPRLTGMRQIFNEGRLAIIQRTGYANSSRSHFQGSDIWGTGDPTATQATGWLGRYLDTLPDPVDPFVSWNTSREMPRTLLGREVGVPAIPDARTYSFASPNNGSAAVDERNAAIRMSSHLPADRPQLAFVNGTSLGALATLDRVASVANYTGTVADPNNGFALALQTIAGTMVRGFGTRVYWVQTGGFDTHSQQGVNAGAYVTLMATLNDGLIAFYNDLRNQGLLNNTLIVQFSEFGRRISENGSQGTDHGAAATMMAIGGGVRGGVYGTAPSLDPNPQNPTLENNGGDVRYETDFRAVYARVLESWLGTSSVPILGADFRAGAPNFL